MPLPASANPSVALAAAGLLLLSLLTHGCGGSTGLAKYVGEDCTTTPDNIALARKSLRNTGLSKCAEVATCDDAFVMAQMAGSAGCERVTLAGEAADSPAGLPPATRADGPTALHVFFESSASMNAYIAQQAGLKDHLLDAVQRMQSPMGRAADSLGFYYVAERSAPYAGAAMDFVASLRPGRLPEVGAATSDIADLVATAFAKTSPTDAIVLVSDYVFSPGRGVNAAQYLSQQKIVIRDLVQRRLRDQADFSVAIVAAEGDFDGDVLRPQQRDLPLPWSAPVLLPRGGATPPHARRDGSGDPGHPGCRGRPGRFLFAGYPHRRTRRGATRDE